MSLIDIIRKILSIFGGNKEVIEVQEHPWTVDYTMLLKCAEEVRAGGGQLSSFDALKKIVKKFESDKEVKWAINVTSGVKGQAWGPTITFLNGALDVMDHGNAFVWCIEHGVTPITLAQ